MKPLYIGLVIPHSFSYYRGILRGVRRYVEAKPHWRFTSVDATRLRRSEPLPADGLIVALNTPMLAEALSRWRRPLVNVSNVIPNLRFPRLGIDNVQVARLAASHFLERGLRKLAFVGPRDHLFSTERKAAFCRVAQAAGAAVVCYDRVKRLPFDPLGQRWDLDRAVQNWLRTLTKPVGIFAADDIWGVQVAEACLRSGLRVPEDVALLGVHNDSLYCELTRPPLSSIMLPDEQVGFDAAALLDRLLSGERPPREPIILPPTGVATRRSTEVLAIDDAEVVTAVRYIRENVHLPLRVTDVLRQVSARRRTMEQRFRAALGWGLGQEIRRARLAHARRLLAATDLPLKALAVQAGFSDYRHLADAFRQELGISPDTFREKLRRSLKE
jgi:LacI family transcriptional regulator